MCCAAGTSGKIQNYILVVGFRQTSVKEEPSLLSAEEYQQKPQVVLEFISF